MTFRALLLFGVTSLIALPVLAAGTPYAGQGTRPVKPLSDDDLAVLRKGETRGWRRVPS